MTTDDPFKTGGGLDRLGAVLGEAVNSLVGNYRILELIGAGGMSRVYRAARDDGRFKRDVAINIPAGLSHRNPEELPDAGLTGSGVLLCAVPFRNVRPTSAKACRVADCFRDTISF